MSNKDIKKVTADFKPIYKAVTEEGALLELDRYEEVLGAKYPLIIRSWRNNWDKLATFLKYPPEIRKLIYTTNMDEAKELQHCLRENVRYCWECLMIDSQSVEAGECDTRS
ncbi:Transposase, Mutator family [compost metagenome]